MHSRLSRTIMLCCLCAAPAARAQFAVIDVGAITQLVAQAQTLASLLAEAESQLAQARSAYAAMTGNRGMQSLLAGVPRNYLPADWSGLQSAMQGGGAYGSLAAGIGVSVDADSVLTAQELAPFPPDVQQLVQDSRRLAALHQNVARLALANASGRFASLQQLIAAEANATDQKAVLDLQARIAAENAMLQNEQTKLYSLHQVIESEQAANRERLSERSLRGQGWFANRFEPVP